MIIVNFVSCTEGLFSKIGVLPYDGLLHSSLEQSDHCPRAPDELWGSNPLGECLFQSFSSPFTFKPNQIGENNCG